MFYLLISVRDALILSILDAYFGKSLVYQLFHMPGINIDSDRPDRIDIPWMPITIRIWQDDADPTRSISWSTTLLVPVCWERWSDAGSRCSVMSRDRFQKLFAVVTWYLVCLVFNLYRFVWGGVPKAVFVMMETGKGGVFFLHIYLSQSVHFHFQNMYLWIIWINGW